MPRARVTCEPGSLLVLRSPKVFVITTISPSGTEKAFGAVAMGDTPDPRPGNNFIERPLR